MEKEKLEKIHSLQIWSRFHLTEKDREYPWTFDSRSNKTEKKVVVNMKKLFPIAAAGVAACFFIAGCAVTSGALIVESDDNVIKIISEKSDDTEATGNLTVKENEYVIFSPDLTGGSVEVKFIQDTGYDESKLPSLENSEIIYESTYSGRVLSAEAIAPGDYYVFIASDNADGTMIITTSNKDEYEKQNEALEKELENLNIELENELKGQAVSGS